jgi:hypothetical protein
MRPPAQPGLGSLVEGRGGTLYRFGNGRSPTSWYGAYASIRPRADVEQAGAGGGALVDLLGTRTPKDGKVEGH